MLRLVRVEDRKDQNEKKFREIGDQAIAEFKAMAKENRLIIRRLKYSQFGPAEPAPWNELIENPTTDDEIESRERLQATYEKEIERIQNFKLGRENA
ncbi:MAG: hypothetical protein ACI84C_002807 [Flavobacteriales bacterium]|jgi:hypothetical protein